MGISHAVVGDLDSLIAQLVRLRDDSRYACSGSSPVAILSVEGFQYSIDADVIIGNGVVTLVTVSD